MKILTEGHKYELENFEEKDKPGQILQFIEKETYTKAYNLGKVPPSNAGYTDNHLFTINDGTTNEELIKVLIDRLKYLSEKLASRETSVAITKLEEALMWLEKRTIDRLKRSVEGTAKI